MEIDTTKPITETAVEPTIDNPNPYGVNHDWDGLLSTHIENNPHEGEINYELG